MAAARAAWGETMPDWVMMLAGMCDRESQALIGREIGYTSSVISEVVNAKYNGDVEAVEKAVRGRFMKMTVDCPVLGDLPANQCLEHQKRAGHFSATSSLRVALTRACRGGCPHSRIGRR